MRACDLKQSGEGGVGVSYGVETRCARVKDGLDGSHVRRKRLCGVSTEVLNPMVELELNIPFYFFSITGASILAPSSTSQPSMKNIITNFHELDEFPLDTRSLPPSTSHRHALPFLDRHDYTYEGFLNTSHHHPKAKGIILTSCKSLEPHSIKTISNGLYMPDAPLVPIHCIGPLLVSEITKDYYKILEVDYDATEETIRSNYIRLALKWHPDKRKDEDSATSRFQDINEAYKDDLLTGVELSPFIIDVDMVTD
ncbi:hypothetical protein QJS04_geneDACA019631 [Acorus gramineus]|uniref:J domain-containing protein n=1 Tax=Acorus gramineus TaxID=55184 RepID=A0AAV9BQM0_ACOGR|nr:hypothetical protein QJS04_geneDACA019631 [Acorus gramineus]